MEARRASAALMRARPRSRIHPSLRRFDRDRINRPRGVSPLLFLMMLMDDRHISVSLACARRGGVGVGAAAERRIAKAIAATSRRHGLALRQGVEAAAQGAVFSDVTAAILV